MTGTSLRALAPSDGLLLRTATWLDVNWCGERVTLAQVDADPELAEYCRLRSGDFGLVSTVGDRETGVVWVKHFPPDRPGYGFVRAGVPELGACVLRATGAPGSAARSSAPPWRRRGAGRSAR